MLRHCFATHMLLIASRSPNHRLVSLKNGQVTFRWRDSAHHNEQKLMTLALDEFLRRFLRHVLPKGFVRIRHFGLLANRRRAQSLPRCFDSVAAQTETVLSNVPDRNPGWFCPLCRCHGCHRALHHRSDSTALSTPAVDISSMKSRSISKIPRVSHATVTCA